MAEPEALRLLAALESNRRQDAMEAKARLLELLNAVKEGWVVGGFVSYHLSTGSTRIVDVLAKAPPPHDRHLCDRIGEGLRGQARAPALALLGHVVRRQPSWLHKIVGLPLFRDLLNVLRSEREIVPLMSGLLLLIALLPMVPTLLGPHLPDVFRVFARLAAWEEGTPERRQHLRLALYGLFESLYGMFPCNFVDFLRQEYGRRENSEVFQHTLRPMLETVRVHPLLVSASKLSETDGARWKKMEHHDVLVECRRLSSEAPPAREEDDARFRSRRGTDAAALGAPPPPRFRRARSSGSAPERDDPPGPGVEGWFSLREACGIAADPEGPPSPPPRDPPTTPAPAPPRRRDGGSSPEAAVEATPENTPVKDAGRRFDFPGGSPAARALVGRVGRADASPPPSPTRKEPSPFVRTASVEEARRDRAPGRLRRVLHDRSHAPRPGEDPPSPRRRSGSPTAAADAAEPDPRPAAERDDDAEERWAEDEAACDESADCTERRHGLHMPPSRTILQYYRRATRPRYHSQCVGDAVVEPSARPERRGGPTARRKSSSCPNIPTADEFDAEDGGAGAPEPPGVPDPDGPAERFKTASTQTVQIWPSGYEFLFPEAMRGMRPKSPKSGSPDRRSFYHVDKYVEILSEGDGKAPKEDAGSLRQRLELVQLELLYERHRREVHAFRNRRLLGRSRKNRAADELILSLKQEVSLLTAEKDDLALQLNKQKQTALFAELKRQENVKYWQDELNAKDREIKRERQEKEELRALLTEQRAQSNESSADVQHLRANLFDVSQQLQRAVRKSEMGDRQLECIRRMQRELIICGERDNKYREILQYLPAKIDQLAAKQTQYYKEQAVGAHAQLQNQSIKMEQLQMQEAELETMLTAKETSIKELKKQLQLAKEENCERVKAVEEKYQSLKRTNQRLEAHCLEILQMVPQSPQTISRDLTSGFSPQSSPLSASLASSEGHGPFEIRNLQVYVNTPHETIEESATNNVNNSANCEDDPH